MMREKNKFRGQVLKDGRITIPSTVRKSLKIEEGQFFQIEIVDDDTIKITFFRV
jgi:AbrB family looped-hinge helix DNA binding protein